MKVVFHKGICLLTFLFVILVAILFALARNMKMSFLSYTSDIFLNAEVSRNVFELGRTLYSTIFNSMWGTHLYFWSVLESPFVVLIGPRFYLFVSGLLIVSSFAVMRILTITLTKNELIASTVALLYSLNPLTLNMLEQPIFGFQYDELALVAIPLVLHAAISCKRTVLFLIVVVFSLFIKEEMYVSMLLIGGYLSLQREWRTRGLMTFALAAIYAVFSSIIINLNAADSYNPATLKVKTILLGNGVSGLIQDFVGGAHLENPYLQAVYNMFYIDGGKVVILLSVVAFFPTLPLFLFLVLLHQKGLFNESVGGFYWKAPYFWALLWSTAVINLAVLAKRGLKIQRHPVTAVVTTVVLGFLVFEWQVDFSRWLRNHPEFKFESVYRYYNAELEEAPFLSRVTPGQVQKRKRELRKIKEIIGATTVVYMPNTDPFAYSDLYRNAHWKAGPGINYYFDDHVVRAFGQGNYAKSIKEGFDVAFESEFFRVYKSARHTVGVEAIQTLKHKDFFRYETFIEVDSFCYFYAEYVKDEPAWPAPSGVVVVLDGKPAVSDAIYIPTIGQKKDDAARVLLFKTGLSAGKHQLEIVLGKHSLGSIQVFRVDSVCLPFF